MAWTEHTELEQPLVPAAILSVAVSSEGAATVVALRGEADVFTLPVVADALDRVVADRSGPVVVDLADTAFIDVRTLHAFARTSHFLGHRGRQLTVRSPSQMAVRVLTILGLVHLIEPAKAT